GGPRLPSVLGPQPHRLELARNRARYAVADAAGRRDHRSRSRSRYRERQARRSRARPAGGDRLPRRRHGRRLAIGHFAANKACEGRTTQDIEEDETVTAKRNGSLGDLTLSEVWVGLRRYQPFILVAIAIVLVAWLLPGKPSRNSALTNGGESGQSANGGVTGEGTQAG